MVDNGDKNTLIVLDFDGVLCIPYTEDHYPEIPEIIRKLEKAGNRLFLASFNPSARNVVTKWGLDEYFEDMRYGSNIDWEDGENPVYKEDLRERMSKSQQIKAMIWDSELKNSSVYFFDDDDKNIEEVRRNLPRVATIKIDETKGLQLNDFIVSELTMQYDKQ